MPVPGFLQSFADKAQSAISATPLGAHIPGGAPAVSPASDAPNANQAAAQGGYNTKGHHALESLHHQFRKVQQQYTSASPVQKIITTSKGVVIDLDSLSRDAKAQSKELYTWGQTQDADLKDVTDRLAYMNFVHGSLTSTLAIKLDSSRASLKELRDAENNLAPRRNIRAGYENQIARIEHNQEKNAERKLAELRDALAKAESEDEALEKEIELLKRKGVKESEIAKWDALREYGEKLVLLSQAASTAISALPSVPSTTANPYKGAQTTAGARASLQRALDNYKTGHIQLPPHQESIDSNASSIRSFGETHSAELRNINTSDASATVVPSVPLTPPEQAPHPHKELGTPTAPSGAKPQPHPIPAAPVAIPGGGVNATSLPGPGLAKSPSSPVINPALLNQSPAPIPSSPPSTAAAAASASPSVPVDPSNPTKVPIITPTVAETGIPVTSPSGPGPASGSLKDIRKEHESSFASGAAPVSPLNPGAALPPPVAAARSYETAEEEKKRLDREERERLLGAGITGGHAPPASAPTYESAEDEKKRLEREERERILAGTQGGQSDTTRRATGDDSELPPYQEPGLM